MARGDQFWRPKVVWGDQIWQLKVVWADHFWLPKVVPGPLFDRTTFSVTALFTLWKKIITQKCASVLTPNVLSTEASSFSMNLFPDTTPALFTRMACHRNFGPENLGPPDRNFQWKNGPPGPIFSVKMVRPWKFAIAPGFANRFPLHPFL